MAKQYQLTLFIILLLNSSIGYGQGFIESSSQLGISHYHHSTNLMGGGMAFFDYDQDGYEDLYITGGEVRDRLFRNIGGMQFQDVSTASGIAALMGDPHRSTSVFTGDINNDGYPDIFIGRQKLHNLLFLNNGDGTFSDITESAGLKNHIAFTMGAVFGDYDLDGFLDIYVINYVKTPNADSNGFYHECYVNWLFKNNGDNTFTEVGSSANVNDKGCALAVNFTDYNQDHRPDIYVANDFGAWVAPNAMLENRGSGLFADVSKVQNLDAAIYGMGIATGDYNKDGLFDYYITNLGRNVLFSNAGGQSFLDVTTAAKVENTQAGDLFSTGWGTVFVDYDHDGYDDLFVGNGEIPAADFIATNLEDPNKLFRNLGDGTFEDVTTAMNVGDNTRSRGVAMADFDKDGDMDIVVNVVNNRDDKEQVHFLFYVNNASENRNWLQVKLQGTSSNFSAFGSTIRLYAAGQLWLRETGGGGSHASQHSNYTHFGLNQINQIDSIVVTWPRGETQRIDQVASNQTIIIVEGQEGFTEEICEGGVCDSGSQPSKTDLPAPSNLNVTFAGRTEGLAITWTDNTADESAYHIEKSTVNNLNTFSLLATLDINTNSYYDTDLNPGETYIYRTKAIGTGDFNNSPYSNYDTITIDSLPAVIDTLYASFNELALENMITWEADTTHIDSFYVERAWGATATDYAVVATLHKSQFTWQDTDVSLDQAYKYRIRSGNHYWHSTYHEPVTIISEISGFGSLSPLDGKIDIFPNPISDGQARFVMSGKILTKPINIVIQDLTGRILRKQCIKSQASTEHSNSLDISKFGAGQYIIQFQTEFGVYHTKLIYLE